MVAKTDGRYSPGWKGVQLLGPAGAVVIGVYPQPERRKDFVAGIDDPVSIPPVFRLIINRQSQKAIRVGRLRLRSEVAKEFGSVIDDAVAVAIQCEKSIVCARRCPSNLNRLARTGYVKEDAVSRIGQRESISAQIENHWATDRLYLAVPRGARRVGAAAPALEKETDAGYRAWHAAGQNVYPERKDFRESSHRFRMDSAKAAKQREGGNRKTTMSPSTRRISLSSWPVWNVIVCPVLRLRKARSPGMEHFCPAKTVYSSRTLGKVSVSTFRSFEAPGFGGWLGCQNWTIDASHGPKIRVREQVPSRVIVLHRLERRSCK